MLTFSADDGTSPGLERVASALRGHTVPLQLIAPSSRGSDLIADMARAPGDAGAVVSTDIPGDVVRSASEQHADLVLLAWERPLIGQSFGGVVQDVLNEARAPVAVLLDRALGDVQRVLVAKTGGPNDRAAATLAQRFGVELTEVAIDAPDALTDAAQGYDLVVVGYDRACGSEPLLRYTPTSLLVVRAAREAKAPVPVMEPAPRS